MPLVYRHNAPWGARRHAGHPSFAERYWQRRAARQL